MYCTTIIFENNGITIGYPIIHMVLDEFPLNWAILWVTPFPYGVRGGREHETRDHIIFIPSSSYNDINNSRFYLSVSIDLSIHQSI